MKTSYLAFLSLFFLSICNLQKAAAQQEFMLKGVVLENGSKIRIALAEVHNLRNNYVVGSNDMGLFAIRALVGDTIVVSKRGFNELTLVATGTKDLVFNLNRINMLDQVTITGQNKKQILDDIKQDFRDKGSFYAGKPPLLSYVFTPLTALYELFGRTPKNARRFNKMYVSELQQNQVDQLFNKTTINQHTGLEGKELEDFLVNYRPDYELSKNWTSYDAIKWILDSHKKYKESKGKKP